MFVIILVKQRASYCSNGFVSVFGFIFCYVIKWIIWNSLVSHPLMSMSKYLLTWCKNAKLGPPFFDYWLSQIVVKYFLSIELLYKVLCISVGLQECTTKGSSGCPAHSMKSTNSKISLKEVYIRVLLFVWISTKFLFHSDVHNLFLYEIKTRITVNVTNFKDTK